MLTLEATSHHFESKCSKHKYLHLQFGPIVSPVQCSCAFSTTRSYVHITGQSDIVIREASQGLEESYPLVYLKLLSHHLSEQQSSKHHLHQFFDSLGWIFVRRPMSTMPDKFYLISLPLTNSSTWTLLILVINRIITSPMIINLLLVSVTIASMQ